VVWFKELLVSLEKEFSNEVEKKYKDEQLHGIYHFCHEFLSAIFHLEFEYCEGRSNGCVGRADIRPTEETIAEGYCKVNLEYQSKIIPILENYIQLIHRFIDTGEFNKYSTYYMGCGDCFSEIRIRKIKDKEEKISRWSDYTWSKSKKQYIQITRKIK